MEKSAYHKLLTTELHETYVKKNHDYGDSFSRIFQSLGILSAVTRIGDKYHRLCSLATKPAEERLVKNESIVDTLMDMANYCLMTVVELKEEEQNE